MAVKEIKAEDIKSEAVENKTEQIVSEQNQMLELSRLRAENEALKQENKNLAETHGSNMGSFPHSLQTSTTKPMWPFRVRVANDAAMPVKDIDAVDESEAIRLYALINSKSGKPLDTVKFRFQVDCLKAAERREFGKMARAERLAAKGYPQTAAVAVGA